MILYAGRLMYHKESPRRQCCTAFVAFHADSLQSLVELLAAGKSFSVTAVQTEPRLTKRQAVKVKHEREAYRLWTYYYYM